MSELMNARNGKREFQWRLLATVSAVALLAAMSPSEAVDQDTDHPTIWIELGGQLERVDSPQQAISPSFMASVTQPGLLSALNVQQGPAFATGEEGKISFEPDDSSWIFSASIRYGRSNSDPIRHHITPNNMVHEHLPTLAPFIGHSIGGGGRFVTSTNPTKYNNLYRNFADGKADKNEAHTILDFQAGKDFGLGLFGRQGSSVLSAGIRFAQFTSKANVNLDAEPDVRYTPSPPINSVAGARAWKYAPMHFHVFTALAESRRSFSGIGPSLAWNASAPFMGNSDAGELTFDWGANVAVLFGRQKASGHHQTTSRTYDGRWYNRIAPYGITPSTPHVHLTGFNRARTIIVPNLGGFAGLSFKWPNAKVSFGYRGDFFLGAVDGGVDTRKSENRGFYGPFATISVGFGG